MIYKLEIKFTLLNKKNNIMILVLIIYIAKNIKKIIYNAIMTCVLVI